MIEHRFTPEDIALKIAEDLKRQETDPDKSSVQAGKAFIMLNALYKKDLREKLFQERQDRRIGKETTGVMQQQPLLVSFAHWLSCTGDGIYQSLFYSENLSKFNVFAENLNLHLSGMCDLLNILDSKFWNEFDNIVKDKPKKKAKDETEESVAKDPEKPYLLFDNVYEIRINSMGNLEIKVRVYSLSQLAMIDEKNMSVSIENRGFRKLQLILNMSDYSQNEVGVYSKEILESTNNRFEQHLKLFSHGKKY